MNDQLHNITQEPPAVYNPYDPYLPSLPRKNFYSDASDEIAKSKHFLLFWLSGFIISILFFEAIIKNGFALGSLMFFLAAESFLFAFMLYKTKPENEKPKLNRGAILLAIPAGIINIGFFLHKNISTQYISVAVLFVIYFMQITFISKPEIKNLFSFGNIPKLIDTVFGAPINLIASPFRAFTKKIGINKNAAYIAAGACIAVPIMIVFIGLFASADSVFKEFLGDIVTWSTDNLGTAIVSTIGGAVICLFLMPMLIGAKIKSEEKSKISKKTRTANNIILATVLWMVSTVLLLFAIIQIGYLFPSNSGAAGYNVTESARQGFFQLSWASFFLFLLVSIVIMLSEKKNGYLINLIKIPLLILCICNMIVLSSAVTRMMYYIDRSGLSVKRILTIWMMGLIAVCMVLIIIKIFRISFNSVRFIAAAVIIFTCALSLFNMDYTVAKNQTDRYITGKIKTFDFEYISTLSYSAAPPIINLIKNMESDELGYYDITELLAAYEEDIKEARCSVFCLTLDAIGE